MKLVGVTVTGADDSIEPRDLLDLSKRFPFVEWGLLLSESRTGAPRFPSQDWWRAFARLQAPLRASGHLCGRWVRDVCDGYDPRDLPVRLESLDRMQLNFHGYVHRIQNHLAFYDTCARLLRPVIFQLDGKNDWIYRDARAYGIDAHPLFDRSGGRGQVPAAWPAPIAQYMGYAGGLGPENVRAELDRIFAVVPAHQRIWIDCETRVRSNQDRQFDLRKVEAFLAACAPDVSPPTGREPNGV